MKLYVMGPDQHKQYLDITSPTRDQLAAKLGSRVFRLNGHIYSVDKVIAEKTTDATPISMVLGGAVGLVGGVAGVLIGGVLGGLLGNDADKKATSEIENFNKS